MIRDRLVAPRRAWDTWLRSIMNAEAACDQVYRKYHTYFGGRLSGLDTSKDWKSAKRPGAIALLLSHSPISALWAGTKHPMWAMYVISATCFPYADLPEPLAPVTIICCQLKQGAYTNHTAEVAVVATVQHSIVVDVPRRAVDRVQRVDTLSDPQDGLLLHDGATEIQPLRRVCKRHQTESSAYAAVSNSPIQLGQRISNVQDALLDLLDPLGELLHPLNLTV